MNNADPMDGWSIKSILDYKIGPARNDAYGKLHHYLKDMFVKFHRRVRSMPTHFTLLHLDALVLPSSLPTHFDRIDVSVCPLFSSFVLFFFDICRNKTDTFVKASHLCDISDSRLCPTLCAFRPLLQQPSINPHATLITLFLEAVKELWPALRRHQIIQGIADEEELRELRYVLDRLRLYMPSTRQRLDSIRQFDPIDIKHQSAVNVLLDVDMYFNLYVELYYILTKLHVLRS